MLVRPICAMRTPQDPEDFLHSAACHCCVMASETSCERANRFLDRRFLVPLPGNDLGFFGGTDGYAAARELGRLLTGSEAKAIADRLTDGDTLTAALKAVPGLRRRQIRDLLKPDGDARPHLIAVLRAIEGARSTITALDTLWTLPGHLAQVGPLTSSVPHLIERARQSITCSTFNEAGLTESPVMPLDETVAIVRTLDTIAAQF